jgi:ubiquinone/menaquinone biosynthesis C-methylase UbiE
MDKSETEEVREFWNRVADDWEIQVGDEGDSNRRLNSDPVLWQLTGDVRGMDVLDVGCGTGYLSRKLKDRGADVTGIDLSEEMIRIAQAKHPDITFHVDSCSELSSLASDSFDLAVANYVLMDTPDLEGTMQALQRVLKRGGRVVLVFSHPCFPQGRADVSTSTDEVTYTWPFPYFGHQKCVDPPWAHFTSDFIWFHRPLSDYWKAFKAAGFDVVDLEEPRLCEERSHLAANERKLKNSRTRPYSIAFNLKKRSRPEA